MNSGRGRGANPAPKETAVARVSAMSKGFSDRTTFFGLCLIGKGVSVQTTDGHTYKGLFYLMKEAETGDRHIVLTHASKDDEKEVLPYAIIPHSVFASLAAEEVDLAGQDIAAAKPFNAPARFEDSDIAHDSGNERTLQAFQFEGEELAPGLEDSKMNGWSGIDMFAENKRRFGIEATFNEAQYTTAVEGANVSAEEAQRIADSIMQQNAGTAHEREERGHIDDSGMTEEDKYGAVLRTGAPPPGTPPGTSPDGKPGPPAQSGASPAADKPGWDQVARRGASPQAAAPPAPANPGGPVAPGTSPPTNAPTAERNEINAVRRKLAEGKSLTTAVPATLRTKYVNDAPAVDALNLMPGTGSAKFRKDKVSNVAHQLDDFKTKRLSGTNTSTVPAGGTAVGGGQGGTLEGEPEPSNTTNRQDTASPAAGTQSEDISSSTTAASTARNVSGSSFKMNPDAKPFSFNPKVAPFTPKSKGGEGSTTGSVGEPGHFGGGRKGGRERGDGVRGGRGGRQGRSSDGFGHHGNMGYRPQGMQQGYAMYGAPVGMVVQPGMPGGPRHAGGGMPQVQAYHAPNGMMFQPFYHAMSGPMNMQGSAGMVPISMAPGVMQPVPTFPQSAQSPPGGNYINQMQG